MLRRTVGQVSDALSFVAVTLSTGVQTFCWVCRIKVALANGYVAFKVATASRGNTLLGVVVLVTAAVSGTGAGAVSGYR